MCRTRDWVGRPCCVGRSIARRVALHPYGRHQTGVGSITRAPVGSRRGEQATIGQLPVLHERCCGQATEPERVQVACVTCKQRRPALRRRLRRADDILGGYRCHPLRASQRIEDVGGPAGGGVPSVVDTMNSCLPSPPRSTTGSTQRTSPPEAGASTRVHNTSRAVAERLAGTRRAHLLTSRFFLLCRFVLTWWDRREGSRQRRISIEEMIVPGAAYPCSALRVREQSKSRDFTTYPRNAAATRRARFALRSRCETPRETTPLLLYSSTPPSPSSP